MTPREGSVGKVERAGNMGTERRPVGPLSMLVVEDDPANQRLMKAMLQTLDIARFHKAYDGVA